VRQADAYPEQAAAASRSLRVNQHTKGVLFIVENIQPKHYRLDALKIEIYHDSAAAGSAAAQAAGRTLRELEKAGGEIGVIFATGSSQLNTLDALTRIEGLPWGQVNGFHMDEYIGLDASHPASFRRYLRERLTRKVAMKEFHEIDGSAPNPEQTARTYAEMLRAANPQLCLLGIGENGHLAFNDPGVASFTDPLDAKIVNLDAECRQQQAAEGWFPSADEVAKSAITLTIPALLRVPKLIVSVPGKRKAMIVRRTLTEPISIDCPTTILRTHPDVTLYLDLESASGLEGLSLFR
jgi:glucosamine-6-phosphate deaminase